MAAEIPGTTDLFEIIRTTRSMRRLKPDPVPNELIRKILEAGVCAPSGGNMQRWRFLVIRDPKVKETVGALYKRAWDEQVAPRYRSGEPAPGMSRERFLTDARRGGISGRHIHEAPVWIVPCLEGGTPTRTSGSSIYPAVQNMLLAATSARPRRDSDDAVLAVREGSGGRTRLAARRPLLCPAADRLPDGPVRASSPCRARRCRLRRSMGPALPGSIARRGTGCL